MAQVFTESQGGIDWMGTEVRSGLCRQRERGLTRGVGEDCGQVAGLVAGDQTIPALPGDCLQQCSLSCPGTGKKKTGGWIHPGVGYS